MNRKSFSISPEGEEDNPIPPTASRKGRGNAMSKARLDVSSVIISETLMRSCL